jgi:hypothetical protein
MWAGGSFHFNRSKQLTIGSIVTESTHVPKVEIKKDMLFVHQEKKLYGGQGEFAPDDWAVKEIRTHVFRTNVEVKRASGGGAHRCSSTFTLSQRTASLV